LDFHVLLESLFQDISDGEGLMQALIPFSTWKMTVNISSHLLFGQLKTHFVVSNNISSNWGDCLTDKVLRTYRIVAFTIWHGVK